MFQRNSMFATKICQYLCLEDSSYDTSDGIIIQLVSKPLHSKIRAHSLRGLNLTYKNINVNEAISSDNTIIQLNTKSNMRSTSSIKPKKKFELINPSCKAKIDETINTTISNKNISNKSLNNINSHMQNQTQKTSTNININIDTLNKQNHFLEPFLKKPIQLNNKNSNTKILVASKEKINCKPEIHKLQAKKINTHQKIKQQYYTVPVTPSKKRRFLSVKQLKKQTNTNKSLFLHNIHRIL